MILWLVLSTLLVAALPLGTLAWLFRRVQRERDVSKPVVAALALAGGVAGWLTGVVERMVFDWAEVSIEVTAGRTLGAVLAVFAFAAPLEEGVKALAVRPTYISRRLDSPRVGLLFAAAVAAGFAAVEGVAYLLAEELTAYRLARVLLALPAHLFCAGLWGYALGHQARFGKRRFRWAWLVATGVHALYVHIVFGRGPGMLALVVPLLIAMGLLGWSALREITPLSAAEPGIVPLPEPPSLRAMRRALRRTDQPLMLHWIAFAAIVNVGVMIAAVAFAVYLGHELGLDFAAADEADIRSNGPIVLLGSAVLLAFPIAGYLVARASATSSVLEPAMGAALAIATVVAMLSLTAPIALLFALAVAPVAFGLACGGAWFGIH